MKTVLTNYNIKKIAGNSLFEPRVNLSWSVYIFAPNHYKFYIFISVIFEVIFVSKKS